jgi:PAS domain S-box-containing protein
MEQRSPAMDTATATVQAAWEKFVSTGAIDPESVRGVIAESWRRCRQAKVDPMGGASSVIATGKELEILLAKSRRLIEAARPFMENLYRLVESSGFVVVLTDHHGFLQEVIGDTEVLESIWGMHYTKGVKCSEELIGTTAISLTLLGYGPIQVAGSEHYCRRYHGWACSAAPIQDGTGNFVGLLSVSGPRDQVHCHTLGMVVSAAAAITNLLQVQKTQRELEGSTRSQTTIVNSISDGLLMLDANGLVTYVNPVGARILNINAAEAIGKHIAAVVEFKPVVLQVLETGRGYTDKEFFIERKRGSLHLVKTAIPLKNKDGGLDGVIDIFREIKRVRKLVNQMVGATAEFNFEDIIGSSQGIQESIRIGKIAANSTANVLIQGESGTGKELIAQAIHNSSSRHDGPFLALNCGAIPRNLVESELFGYEEGSFTGAQHGGRPGKFELVHGGTMFLDEIGEMPLDIQVKLLRVLQEKRITRLGGQRCIDVDVRVIAASNRDLASEVKDGNFRPDLYYRLNVLPIQVPPLRERQEDILCLVEFLLAKMCRQLGVATKHFTPEALDVLVAYEWPGNVRELENVIERAVNICEGPEMPVEYLPRTLLSGSATKEAAQQVSLRNMEHRLIEEAIQRTGGNISHAAKLLGIGRNTLYSKLKQYRIPHARNSVVPSSDFVN